MKNELNELENSIKITKELQADLTDFTCIFDDLDDMIEALKKSNKNNGKYWIKPDDAADYQIIISDKDFTLKKKFKK
jgi:hypothetical protein